MARTHQTSRKTLRKNVLKEGRVVVHAPAPSTPGKKSGKKSTAIESEPEPLPTTLPKLPAPPAEFLSHLAGNRHLPIRQVLEPYLEYETVVRQYLAQAPDHEFVKDNTVNLLSVFDGDNAKELVIQARDVSQEPPEETQKYMMPLSEKNRKKNGDPCIVQDMETFKSNFAIFSESSLANLDWSNVVVAGSAVLTPLLVVPEKYQGNKRALREYYHQILAPASDIDLFIYGIDDEQEAIKKMEAIEKTVQDNLLWETTTIRTRNTITIVSQYPNRHVQIVLRLYKSISQILTGFDVNCSCFAFDGERVLANPRALEACITQCNNMDLSRRSPSYENRLSKYSKRGFEVYCPFLDRSRIDPTIFERSFGRTVGLARLLVLEALPTTEKREKYQVDRRYETQRLHKPVIQRKFTKNKKDYADDEVAEWDFEDHSSYQKFNIPYGDGITAKQIEKLFFRKDLLLNAEWNATNQPPHREVNLHRHPVFLGDVQSIVQDCCGYCPEPVTDEERLVAEEEDQVYVKGKMKMLTWLGDDPGRQEVGSFHPLGPEDYTDMAYVGSSARLCQAIVDDDAEAVKAWCAQEDMDINCRDFCGRTPLHLACQSRTTGVDVVQALLDRGAKIIARVQDGRTALHMAAIRGAKEIVVAILNKSAQNEQARDEREARAKDSAGSTGEGDVNMEDALAISTGNCEADSFENIAMSEAESKHAETATTVGFVKVETPDDPDAKEFDEVDEDEEDDILDINTEDWDNGMSALHCAILAGHPAVVEALISEFGADVRQTRKKYAYDWTGAKIVNERVMNLVIAMSLEGKAREEMVSTLLKLGISSAQSLKDVEQMSSFHHIVCAMDLELLKIVFDLDGPGASSVINNCRGGQAYRAKAITPLVAVLDIGSCANDEGTPDELKDTRASLVRYLLSKGAHAQITVADTIRNLKPDQRNNFKDEYPELLLMRNVKQPIEYAIDLGYPAQFIRELVEAGADHSTVLTTTQFSHQFGGSYGTRLEQTQMPLVGYTPLDLVRQRIENHRKELDIKPQELVSFRVILDESAFTVLPEGRCPPGSYRMDSAKLALKAHNQNSSFSKSEVQRRNEDIERENAAIPTKKAAIEASIKLLEDIESVLIELGAKTYHELQPEVVERLKNAEQTDNRQALLFGSNNFNFNHYFHHNLTVGMWEKHEREVQESILGRFTIPWNFHVPFLGEGNIKRGYVSLYENVWRGDPEDHRRVKLVTLGPSGEGNNRLPPLRITCRDQYGRSLLAIAIMRGKYEMIDTIMEVVAEQYVPNEPEAPNRYRESHGHDADYSVEDINDDASDGVRFEKVEEKDVEVEDNSPMQNLAKCSISPWQYFFSQTFNVPESMFSLDEAKAVGVGQDHYWTALEWAIAKNDRVLYEKIISLAKSLPTSVEKAAGAGLRMYAIDNQKALCMAVRLGRTDVLDELMRSCSFGIPYDKLRQNDPTLREEDAKYYQGLTIRGRKQKAWVDSANPNGSTGPCSVFKPLEQAICNANMATVDWLYSERPWACFQRFISDNAPENSKEIQLLGVWGDNLRFHFDKAMGLKTTQLVKFVILHWDADKSPQLLRFFANKPGGLQFKDNDYLSPALLAVQNDNLDAAKLLLDLGADFSRRDAHGRNVLHVLTTSLNKTHEKPLLLTRWNEWLSLLPADIVADSWTHRTLGTRLTPLAFFIEGSCAGTLNLTLFECILDRSDGRELAYSDCKGNMIIHTLFNNNMYDAIRVLIARDPALLHIENAMGMTPYELGLASRFREAHLRPHYQPMLLVEQWRGVNMIAPLVDTADQVVVVRPDAKKLWELVLVNLKAPPVKRKLCALAEANELAKRVWYQARVNAEMGEKEKRREERRVGRVGRVEESEESEEE